MNNRFTTTQVIPLPLRVRVPEGRVRAPHPAAARPPSPAAREGKRISLGFSLLELYIVIFIAGLLLSIGIPNYNQFLMRIEREITLDRLKTIIEYARQEALTRGKTITLCASMNQRTCQSSEWGLGFIVFEEIEYEGISLKKNHILQTFPALKYGILNFNHFGNNLSIQADGTTINNGTFIYCPKNENRREADGLIINSISRTYRPTQRNSLGIFLKATGTTSAEPFTCR